MEEGTEEISRADIMECHDDTDGQPTPTPRITDVRSIQVKEEIHEIIEEEEEVIETVDVVHVFELPDEKETGRSEDESKPGEKRGCPSDQRYEPARKHPGRALTSLFQKQSFTDRMNNSSRIYRVTQSKDRDPAIIRYSKRGRPKKNNPAGLKVTPTKAGPMIGRRSGRPRLSEIKSRLTLEDLKELDRVDDSQAEVSMHPDKLLSIEANLRTKPSKLGQRKIIRYTADKGLVISYEEKTVPKPFIYPPLSSTVVKSKKDSASKASTQASVGVDHSKVASLDITSDNDSDSKEECIKVNEVDTIEDSPTDIDKFISVDNSATLDDHSPVDDKSLTDQNTPEELCSPVSDSVLLLPEGDQTDYPSDTTKENEVIVGQGENDTEAMPNATHAKGECLVCHIRLTSFHQHADEHVGGEYPCHTCKVKFKSTAVLSVHAAIHVKPGPLMVLNCSLCSERLMMHFSGPTKEEMLKKHVHDLHPLSEKTFKCPVCMLNFRERNLHLAHVENHKPVHKSCSCKHKECYACSGPDQKQLDDVKDISMKSDSARSFKMYYTADKSMLATADPCTVCQLKTIPESRHMLTVHQAKGSTFSCPICKAGFNSDKMAELHQKIHTGKEIVSSKGPKDCSICGERTLKMYNHVVTWHKDAPLLHCCCVCGMKFPEKILYMLHLKSHMPHTCKCGSVGCHVCQIVQRRSFSVYNSWEEFLQIGEQCKECQLKILDMDHHMAEHKVGKATLYSCSVCDVAFVKRHVAQRHLKIHSGKKLRVMNRCSLCDTEEMDLFKHVMEKHRNATCAHKCRVCEMSFPEINLFQFHCESHIPDKCNCNHPKCFNCFNQQQKQLDISELKHKEPDISEQKSTSSLLNPIKEEKDITTIVIADEEAGGKYAVCQKCFIRVTDMDSHLKEHDMSKAKFRCKVCKVTFQRNEMITMHTTIHGLNKPSFTESSCSLCYQKKHILYNRFELLAHVKKDHWLEENKYECVMCDAKFPCKSILAAHNEVHYPTKCTCGNQLCKFCTFYLCRYCNVSFKRVEHQQYASHFKQCSERYRHQLYPPVKQEVSPVVLNPPIMHESPVKKTIFATSQPILIDADDMQGQDSQPSTPSPSITTVLKIARVTPFFQKVATVQSRAGREDQQSSANEDSDASQEEEDQNEEQSDEEETETECTICGEMLPSGSIVNHFKSEHLRMSSALSQECSVCHLVFKTRNQLLCHSIAHLPPRYICGLCNLNFKTIKSMAKHHEEKHHNAGLTCSLCLEEFRTEEAYKHHKRAYMTSNPRKFPCNWCCVSFHSQADLGDHKTVHGKECKCSGANCKKCTKFQCGCSTIFKAHEFLHYRIHSMKCFRCYACRASFDNDELLLMHERNHYRKCKVCGTEVKYAKDLLAHMEQSNHKCKCPRDSPSCLTCRKTWCTFCGKRFMQEELIMYRDHKAKCVHSDLLCICRDKDCFICQKYKCSCGRSFRKHQFATYSMHRRRCASLTPEPDPFLKIKTEPIVVNLDEPRRRKKVDPTVISLDSDDENAGDNATSSEIQAASDRRSHSPVSMGQESFCSTLEPDPSTPLSVDPGSQCSTPGPAPSTPLSTEPDSQCSTPGLDNQVISHTPTIITIQPTNESSKSPPTTPFTANIMEESTSAPINIVPDKPRPHGNNEGGQGEALNIMEGLLFTSFPSPAAGVFDPATGSMVPMDDMMLGMDVGEQPGAAASAGSETTKHARLVSGTEEIEQMSVDEKGLSVSTV